MCVCVCVCVCNYVYGVFLVVLKVEVTCLFVNSYESIERSLFSRTNI